MKDITISLVIPVYNEQKRINKAIDALKKGFNYSPLKLEKVIFVDDGSKDDTVFIISKHQKELESILKAKVEIVTYAPNKGKGYAIRQGMKESDSDYTLFFDVDMATPLEEIQKFIPYMLKNKDVIVGTRKNGESTVQVHQPKYRELLGRGFTLISKIMLNTWVTDFTCGFKAFSRQAKNDIFPRSRIDRWGYDAEIIFLANKLGYEITEKAVLWYDDHNTKVKLFKAIYTTMKELLEIRYYDLSGKYNLSRNELYEINESKEYRVLSSNAKTSYII